MTPTPRHPALRVPALSGRDAPGAAIDHHLDRAVTQLRECSTPEERGYGAAAACRSPALREALRQGARTWTGEDFEALVEVWSATVEVGLMRVLSSPAPGRADELWFLCYARTSAQRVFGLGART